MRMQNQQQAPLLIREINQSHSRLHFRFPKIVLGEYEGQVCQVPLSNLECFQMRLRAGGTGNGNQILAISKSPDEVSLVIHRHNMPYFRDVLIQIFRRETRVIEYNHNGWSGVMKVLPVDKLLLEYSTKPTFSSNKQSKIRQIQALMFGYGNHHRLSTLHPSHLHITPEERNLALTLLHLGYGKNAISSSLGRYLYLWRRLDGFECLKQRRGLTQSKARYLNSLKQTIIFHAIKTVSSINFTEKDLASEAPVDSKSIRDYLWELVGTGKLRAIGRRNRLVLFQKTGL